MSCSLSWVLPVMFCQNVTYCQNHILWVAKFDGIVQKYLHIPKNCRNKVTFSVVMVTRSPLLILFLEPVSYLVLNSASLYDFRFLLLMVLFFFLISLAYSILKKSYLKIGNIPVLLP